MIGYPKFINTKADLEYCLKNFPGDGRNTAFLQSLLDERFGWYPCEKCDADATHKIVEATDMMPESYYELRENPTARIYQLGLTVDEVQAMLEG